MSDILILIQMFVIFIGAMVGIVAVFGLGRLIGKEIEKFIKEKKMERIGILNKALTSKNVSQIPSVPSLAGSKVSIIMTPLPSLNNFVKSHASCSFKNRKIGIYKLVRKSAKSGSSIAAFPRTNDWTVLSYSLEKTTYVITSCICESGSKIPAKNIEGNIKIYKGFFKNKTFTLSELPKNIVDSINENIFIFNEVYRAHLERIETDKVTNAKQKEQSFFEGLDL